jgi:hypothetical protein
MTPTVAQLVGQYSLCCRVSALNGATADCRGFKDLTALRQGEITAALSDYKCSSAESEPDIANSYICRHGMAGSVGSIAGSSAWTASSISISRNAHSVEDESLTEVAAAEMFADRGADCMNVVESLPVAAT